MLRGPIRFTNALGGTTDFIYPGPAIDMQSPASAGAANGATYVYYAQSLDMSEWEIGSGAYTSASGTFARTAVAANSLGTTAKIDFTDPAQVFVFDTATAFLTAADVANFVSVVPQTWTLAQAYQAQRNIFIPVSVRGHIDGLTLSAGGSSSFSIASGVATDTTAADVLINSGTLVKTTAAWAVGSGNGGLDTGAIANGWYYPWLIKRQDTGVVDALISLSATAPTMPANYTLKRRIGALKNSGGNWVGYIQLGDKFMWLVPTLDDTTAVGTTAALITLNVPPGIQVDAEIFGLGVNAAAGTVWMISSPDQTDTLPSAAGPFSGIVGVAGVNVTYSQVVRTDTSGRIRKRASAATTTIYVNTFGWIDRRGRDA